MRTQLIDNVIVFSQSAHNSTEYSLYRSTERPSSLFTLKKFVDGLWCNIGTRITTKLDEFESLLVLGQTSKIFLEGAVESRERRLRRCLRYMLCGTGMGFIHDLGRLQSVFQSLCGGRYGYRKYVYWKWEPSEHPACVLYYDRNQSGSSAHSLLATALHMRSK